MIIRGGVRGDCGTETSYDVQLQELGEVISLWRHNRSEQWGQDISRGWLLLVHAIEVRLSFEPIENILAVCLGVLGHIVQG